MVLFHSSNIEYADNYIILTGNWGKLLFESGLRHQSWNREMALEAVRAWNFPYKPSRLKATFACDNLATMKCYHFKNNPDGFVYEVSIEDNTAPFHKGDFNAVEPLPRVQYGMWELANLYWEYGFKTLVDT